MRLNGLSGNERPTRIGSIGWTLEGQHSGEILAFRRLVTGRNGFSLLVLQYNDPAYRDKIIPHLNLHAKNPTVFRPDPQSGYADFEERFVQFAAGHDLIHVVGLSEWLTGGSRNEKFRGLNYHREYIAEKAPVVIALWMTEKDIRDFALQAPDMWAWRTAVIDFAVSARKPAGLELSRLDFEAADLTERRQRMKEIEDYLAEHPEESIPKANLLRELGLIYQFMWRIDDALRALTEAAAIYRGRNFKREHAIVLGDIARIYAARGDIDEALRLHRQELEVYDQLGDMRSRAVALADLARIYASRGDVDDALKLHRESMEVFEQLGDRRFRALALGYIARIYAARGEIDEALRLHKERVETFEQLGDRRSRAVALGDIARIYASRGDVDEALKLHKEEAEIFEQLGDRRSRAVVLGDIAGIYADMGDVVEALKLYKERLEAFEQLGDLEGKANSLWSIGRIEALHEDSEGALKHLSAAYSMLLKIGRIEGVCHVGLDLGRLLFRLNETEKGAAILQRSEEGFRRLGRDDLARAAMELLAQAGKSSAPVKNPSHRAER